MFGVIGELYRVPLYRVVVHEQARKDFGNIDELAKDIAENGLTNPLSVDADCNLIAGERRFRAVKQLGWEDVPVIVVPAERRSAIQYGENAHRKGLTASELAVALKARTAELERLVAAKAAVIPAGKTVKEVVYEEAVKAGAAESVTDIERKKRIVEKAAPELVDAVDREEVSVGAAVELLSLPKDEQAAVAKQGKKAAAAKAAEVVADRKAKKGKGEPKPKAEETPEPEQVDGLGNPVPDGAADAFFDPALRNLVVEVFDHGKALKALVDRIKGVARKSAAWPFANFGQAMIAVANAIDDIKHAHAHLDNGVPFAVCPQCGGSGCPACSQSGHFTKHMHDNADQYGG